MSESFGELRGLLHTTAPDARTWEALVTCIHALSADEREAALDYAADFMERAPWERVTRLTPGQWVHERHPALRLVNAFSAPDPDTLCDLLPRLPTERLRELTIIGDATLYGTQMVHRVWHDLTPRHLEALAALPALEEMTLWTLRLEDWGVLARAPLARLRRLTLRECAFYGEQLIALGRARWPALEHLEASWLAYDPPMRPSMAELRAFAHESALDSLKTLALPDAYIYSDEEEDWIDWNGGVVGRGPRRAWAKEARTALTARWPDIKLIN